MTGTTDSVAAFLEREHREIDESIERFSQDPASKAAAEALAVAIATLRRHIYVEEEAVFPALSAGGLVPPVLVMLREHAQIWDTLDELERAVAAGDGAVDTPPICRQLLVQLQHHNVKEERILYPEADQALSAESAASLTQFLESGALPDGWVCIRARS